jgi:hypothetical protein
MESDPIALIKHLNQPHSYQEFYLLI